MFGLEYLVLLIVPMLLGFWAQRRVTSTFRRYSDAPSSTGMTGEQVARRILDLNGLHDVPVRAVPGELSDHYDPRDRSVNLSESVFGMRTVSAVAVAAHEVGHAIQHQQAYIPMRFRSALAPVAAFGQNMFSMLVMVGFMLMIMNMIVGGTTVIMVGVVFYTFAVLFHIITLPVEFDASRRAKRQLTEGGMLGGPDAAATSDVLGAAAMTYVAGALVSIGQLLYWVVQLMAARN